MPSTSVTRSLALIGLAGIVVFAAAILMLHVQQPELSPLNEAMSYYVHGAHGWLLTVGLIALGMGSLAITLAVGSTAAGRTSRLGISALTVWSVGTLLGGIFTADPPGNWDQPPSISGAIHGIAALVALAAFPVGCVTLTHSLRRDDGWQRHSGILRLLAWASVLAFIAFMGSLLPVLISPGPPVWLGITERVMLAAYGAWLAACARSLSARATCTDVG